MNKQTTVILLPIIILSFLLSATIVAATAGDIKVTATNELGGALSGATVEIQCTGGAYTQLTGSPVTNASGIVQAAPQAASDCNDTDAVNLRVSKDGYVTNTTASAGTYTAASDPSTDLSTTVQYTVKVTSVVDELGAPHTMDGADVTITSSSGTVAYNGGMAYIPASPGASPVTLTASKSGFYISSMGGVVPASNAQNQVNFTSSQTTLKYNVSMTLNASTAKVGDTIKVSGTAFPANLPDIYLNISGTVFPMTAVDGTAQSSQGRVNASASGTWNATFILTDISAGAKIAGSNNGQLANDGNASLTIQPKIMSINPIGGDVNSTAINSTAIVIVTGFAASSALTVKFNSTSATVISGGITNANGTATLVNVTIPAVLPGMYDVNVTDASSNSAVLSPAFNVTDHIQPMIVSISLGEPDNFVSATSPNNGITVIVNATDAGYGATGVRGVAANFSQLNGAGAQSGNSMVNMTYNATTQLWSTTFTVTNVSALTEPPFGQFNITVLGGDYANNHLTGQDTLNPPVVLYSMTTPPLQGVDPSCMIWDTVTTDLSKETNMNSVNYVVAPMINLSCNMNPTGMPPWFSQLTRLALLNFTGLNMTSQSVAQQLAALADNMQIDITPPNQFGDSRIFFNTSALAAFSAKSASVTIYHLPFTSMPAVIADAGSGGNATSLSWTDDGNLTFTVNHFSGYNESDNVTPTISIHSPTSGLNTTDNTPLINVTLNGTITQISKAVFRIGTATVNFTNETNAANCAPISNGSEKFNCLFNWTTLPDAGYTLNVTAWDFGDGAGNSASATVTFTIDTTAPTVAITNLASNTIIGGTTYNITGTVSDAMVGVNNVTFYKDGVVQGFVDSVTPPTWSHVWTLVGGTYNLTFMACDKLNQCANASVTNITVDKTNPAVFAASATPTPLKNTTTMLITVNATDDDSVYSVTVSAGTPQSMTLSSGDTYSVSATPAALGCLANGVCILTFNATDALGNYNDTTTTTVTVDTTAPVTTATGNISNGTAYIFNSWTSSTYVNVTLACADANGCSVTKYCLDAANICTPNITYTVPVQISTGEVSYIRYLSNDSVNNVETVKNQTIKIDKTAPAVTINKPAAAPIKYNANFTINVTITDNTALSAKKYKVINTTGLPNPDWTNLTQSGSSNDYIATFNVDAAVAGNYTLYINATDNAGYSNDSVTRAFIIYFDTQKPAVFAAAATPTPLKNTTIMQITVNATDDDAVYSVTVSAGTPQSMTASGDTYSVSATPASLGCLADGICVLRFNATDNVGNYNDTITKNVTVDTTAPVTTATGNISTGPEYTFDSWTTSTYVNVTLTCADAGGVGCDKIFYCTDTANSCTIPTTATSPVTVQISTEGTSYIRYLSNDSLNNVETVKNQTIKIDTTAPAVTINKPTASGWYNANFTISASIADAGTLVKQQYKITNGSGAIHTDWTNLTLVSGYYTATFNATETAEGNYTLQINTTDSVGHVNDTVSALFWVDRTAPTISSFSLSDTTPKKGDDVTGTCAATDNSGSATTAITGIDTDSTGTKTATCTATDSAGNSVTSTKSYTVSAKAGTGGGGTSGGGAAGTSVAGATAIVSSALAGETVEYKIISTDIAISAVDITFAIAATNTKVNVNKLSSLPTTMTAPISKIYQVLTIINTNIADSAVKTAEINFKVSKSWLTENGIDKSEIALFRMTDKWNELPTTVLSEDADYVYFTATTSGFSYFLIGQKGAAAPAVTTPETTPEVTPAPEVAPTAPVEKQKEAGVPQIPTWIWWVIGICVVVGFVLFKLLKRR
jgi:PGF-pre-PGF domain-containing protein